MKGLIKKILKEEDEFDWAKEAVSNMAINPGDVFYVVDNNPEQTFPDNYKPKDARYVMTIVDIIPNKNDELIVIFKSCNPENTTYNAKDYSIKLSRCYDYENPDHSDNVDENGYEDVTFKWFTERLIATNYWRKM